MRKKIIMALCAAVMSTAIKAQPAFPPMMGGGNSNEDVASYKQVKVGDILVCRHFIDRDFYQTYDLLQLECDITVPETPFIGQFHSIVDGIAVKRTDFMDSCGDNFVTEGESHGEDVVDMESFAELQACREMGIPFFAIKYVTDIIGQNSLDIWEKRLATAKERLKAYLQELDL